MAINSCEKGKNFEREVVHFLDANTGANWKRVPQSGAFSTVNVSGDPRFKGDVFTEHPMFSGIVIECKATKDFLRLEDLVNPKSKIWSWIQQATEEAGDFQWMLIFKANRGDMFLLNKNNGGNLLITALRKDAIRHVGNFKSPQLGDYIDLWVAK